MNNSTWVIKNGVLESNTKGGVYLYLKLSEEQYNLYSDYTGIKISFDYKQTIDDNLEFTFLMTQDGEDFEFDSQNFEIGNGHYEGSDNYAKWGFEFKDGSFINFLNNYNSLSNIDNLKVELIK